MMSEIRLPADWDRFCSALWQRTPGVLPRRNVPFIAGPSEVFHGLTRTEGVGSPWRFYIEGQPVARAPEYLPRPDDGDLAGYAARLRGELAGRRFGLNVGRFQLGAGRAVFERVCSFLEGLYEQVGLPLHAVDFDVFIGTYGYTPFGVHRDTSSSFTFVVQGRKRLLTWPEGTFTAAPPIDSPDFRRARADACVLEGEAGDLLHWSTSDWHVAEADDDALAATIGLAYYHTDPWPDPDQPSAAPGKPLPRAVVQDSSGWVIPPGPAGAFPGPFGEAIAERLTARWLARQSAWGFQHLPAAALEHETVEAGDRLRAAACPPLLWLPLGRGALVGAGGRVIRSDDPDVVASVLRRLRRGEAVARSSLLDDLPGASRPAAERLLDALVRTGVVAVERA
jgi:hypothetical protein